MPFVVSQGGALARSWAVLHPISSVEAMFISRPAGNVSLNCPSIWQERFNVFRTRLTSNQLACYLFAFLPFPRLDEQMNNKPHCMNINQFSFGLFVARYCTLTISICVLLSVRTVLAQPGSYDTTSNPGWGVAERLIFVMLAPVPRLGR